MFVEVINYVCGSDCTGSACGHDVNVGFSRCGITLQTDSMIIPTI